MTAEQWVCGWRQTLPSGTWECVAAPDHDGNHYLIRLVHKKDETA